MNSLRTLNVLQFICPTGFYGAERWILALSNHLPPDQVRCDLAVTQENPDGELEIVSQYRKTGGNVFELPMRHRFDISVIDKLVALIENRQIDVIHTHGYKSDILGILAARKAGIKCVVTPHGFENSKDPKLRLFIWLGKLAMKYAHAVAPLSRQLIDDVKAAGVSSSSIHYIQNGVDLSEVEAIRATGVDHNNATNQKIIGFIGQLISRKNVKDILDIFDRLAEKRQDIVLQIVGDGEQRNELEQHMETLSHRDRVEFLGFRNDRLQLLKNFNLFVMTSTLEGIPRCLMEACAMGIPVAAYDIPGIDQLITHDETGLLAPAGDSEGLLLHWDSLLSDQEQADRLAENARNFVSNHYSANRMAEEYLDLYQALLE